MSEPLYRCPLCKRTGFTAKGLRAHHCPAQSTWGGRRQVLPANMILKALKHPLPEAT